MVVHTVLMCGYYVIKTLLAHHHNWSIHLQRHHLGPLLMSSLDHSWVNQLTHSPFLTYAHKVNMELAYMCRKTMSLYIKQKQYWHNQRKKKSYNKQYRRDKKKREWSKERILGVNTPAACACSLYHERVNLLFRHRGKRQHYHQPTTTNPCWPELCYCMQLWTCILHV